MSDKADRLGRWFWVWLGAAIASAIAVLAFYAIEFWPGGPWLSDSQTAWGEFGEYVGGTLGALFGFFAFVGVLLTVYWQRRQLMLMRQQAEIDQLQRLLQHVAEALDERLSVDVTDVVTNSGLKVTGRVSLHHALGLGATRLLDPSTTLEERKQVSQIKASIPLDVLGLSMELGQLAVALKAYRAKGGSSEVVRFYVLRFRHPAAYVTALDHELEDTSEVFEVKETLLSLSPAKTDSGSLHKPHAPP